MKRVNCILIDCDFIRYMDRIKELEQDRTFCHHDMSHLLDVCRIAWILNLEEGLFIDQEMIYAAGLLHDIGRWKQYETSEDHAIVSRQLAGNILTRCGFSNDEKNLIMEAIESHRKKDHRAALSSILYKSDKLSRPCFSCEARGQCKKFQNGEQPVLIY